MTHLSSFFTAQPSSNEGNYKKGLLEQRKSLGVLIPPRTNISCSSSEYRWEGVRSMEEEMRVVCVRCTLFSLPGLLPPVLPLGADRLRSISRLLDPVVIMEPNTAAWCVLVSTPAAHPVGTSIRQVMVVRFRVPTAQGNVPALILPLTLLAGIIPVERVLIPAWIHCPHPICLDQHLEVVTGAFEGCQGSCGQVTEDVDHYVVREQQHVLARFKQALDLKADLQKIMGHVAVEAAQRRVWTVFPNAGQGRVWTICPLPWDHSYPCPWAVVVGTVQRANSWPPASACHFSILLCAPLGLKEEELSRRRIIWWGVSGAAYTPTNSSPTRHSKTYSLLLNILCTVLAIKHTLVHSTCHHHLHMKASYTLPPYTPSFLFPRRMLLGCVRATTGLPVWVMEVSVWFGGSSCGSKQQTTGVSWGGTDKLVQVTGDFLFGPGCCLVTPPSTAHEHTAGPASWLQLRPWIQIWYSESYPHLTMAVTGGWRRCYNSRFSSSPMLLFSISARKVYSRTSSKMKSILQVLGFKVCNGLGYPARLLLLLQLLVCLDGRWWFLGLFGRLAIWTFRQENHRSRVWYCSPEYSVLMGSKALIMGGNRGLVVLIPMNSHNALEGHSCPLLNQGNHLCHWQ